jgi:hypothetical protein
MGREQSLNVSKVEIVYILISTTENFQNFSFSHKDR